MNSPSRTRPSSSAATTTSSSSSTSASILRRHPQQYPTQTTLHSSPSRSRSSATTTGVHPTSPTNNSRGAGDSSPTRCGGRKPSSPHRVQWSHDADSNRKHPLHSSRSDSPNRSSLQQEEQQQYHYYNNHHETAETTAAATTTTTPLPDYTLGSSCSFRSKEEETEGVVDGVNIHIGEEEEETEEQEEAIVAPSTITISPKKSHPRHFNPTDIYDDSNYGTTFPLKLESDHPQTTTTTTLTSSSTTAAVEGAFAASEVESTTTPLPSLSAEQTFPLAESSSEPQPVTESPLSFSSTNKMVWKRNKQQRRNSNNSQGTNNTSESKKRTNATKTPTRGGGRRKEPGAVVTVAESALPQQREPQQQSSPSFRLRFRGGNHNRNKAPNGGDPSSNNTTSNKQPQHLQSPASSSTSIVLLDPLLATTTEGETWESFESSTPFIGHEKDGFFDFNVYNDSPDHHDSVASLIPQNSTNHRPNPTTSTAQQKQQQDNEAVGNGNSSIGTGDSEDDSSRPLYETPYKQSKPQPASPPLQKTVSSPHHYHHHVYNNKAAAAPPSVGPSSTFSTATTSTTPTTEPGDLMSLASSSPQPYHHRQQQQQQQHQRTHSTTSSSTSSVSTGAASNTAAAATPNSHSLSLLSSKTTLPPSLERNTQHPPPSFHHQHYNNNDHISVSSSSQPSLSTNSATTSDLSHLLTPPVPEDRSERRRLAYETKKRRKAAVMGGVYDGELEPEGVRGQEAEALPPVVLPTAANTATNATAPTLPNIRTFGPNDAPSPSILPSPSGNTATLRLSPATPSLSAFRDPPPPPPPHPVPSGRPSSHSSSPPGQNALPSTAPTNGAVPQQQQQQQSRPRPILRHSTPPSSSMYPRQRRHHNAMILPTPQLSASTSSDELLDEMRSDLIPDNDDQYYEQQQAENDNFFESPSSVAAAAAAAAARTLQSGPVTAPKVWPDDQTGLPAPSSSSPSAAARQFANSAERNGPANAGGAGEEDDDDDDYFEVDEWNRLAMQNVERGQYDEALVRFTRVLQWQTKQHGALHPAVASAHHNLGTVHAKRAAAAPEGSLEEQEAYNLALHSFQAAARTARDSLSPQHPNVAVSLVRIGFLLLQTKQYENAVITFREALRIRQAAYGPRHALVANLYNNLGVCQMHLGNFEQGKEALEHALEVQRELFVTSSDGASTTNHSHNTGSSVTTSTSIASKLTQSLEIADTLFNIGGLCLEWIRKRGHDLRRQQDAEAAFEEALMIRADVLGPQNPLTIQVRDLLEMTQAIPKPRPLAPKKSDSAPKTGYDMNPEEVLSVSTPHSSSVKSNHQVVKKNHHQHPQQQNSYNSEPPQQEQQRPSTPPDFADRVMGHLTTNSSDRYSVLDERNNTSPLSRPTTPNSATRSTTPNSTGRSTTPTSTGTTSPGRSRSGTPSSPLSRSSYKAPGTPNSPKRRHGSSSTLSPSRSEAPLSPGRQIFCGKNGAKNPLEARTMSTGSSTTSFRTPSTNTFKAPSTPTRESSRRGRILVTLSTEEEDDEQRIEHSGPNSQPRRNDRIFREFRDLDGAHLSDMYGRGSGGGAISPLQRSGSSGTRPIESERSRRNRNGGEGAPPVSIVTVRSSGDEVEVSHHGTKVFVRQHHVPLSPERSEQNNNHRETTRDRELLQDFTPFDTEENCLIGDTGIDSEFGRVHIPSAWAKAGLVLDEDDPDQRQREIMVTRPSRISDSSRTPGRHGEREEDAYSTERPDQATDQTSQPKTRQYDTGNKERDEIMRRARAFIEAYERNEKLDSKDPAPSLLHSSSATAEDVNEPENDSVDDSLQAEDGLAKLGGDWVSCPSRRNFTYEEMETDPTTFLPEIYEDACRRLKRDDVDGALPLFTTILRCQRERYGDTHEHTASALYNLGIAHLRGQNGEEALEAFEEATHVRRSIFGQEHPSIAITLVKVGITNLLLHRFEEALWNFREALSVRKRVLGPHHPSTARIYNNIGCVHVEFNELREARRAFETALEIQRSALSEDPDSRGIMLATATTLCNLGYLYRHRELHGKAAQALKEAADLQETVLGRSNPAVLSTLDCLADSSASGGQTTDALRYFNMILTRYRVGGAPGSQTVLRAEAVLLYKMSRVHRQRNDRESQLDTLKLALRSVRALSDAGPTRKDALERRIVYDMRSCREQINKNKMKWI